MIQLVFRFILIATAAILTGCAANQLPGYQNTYYSYNVQQSQLDQIQHNFIKFGLKDASVIRDSVGRVRLAGNYRDEDQVDQAYIIVQSIVGIKSTSPIYPQQIAVKRWEIDAGKAMDTYAKTSAANPVQAKARKRALIIGISKFRSPDISQIPGEEDAHVVQQEAKKAGYEITALLGKDATKSAIIAAIDKLDREIGPGDYLFIYISSHGTLPVPAHEGADHRKMSIVAYDTEIAKMRSRTEAEILVNQTSVPDSLVQHLVKKPTRNTRLIIDTCYSGEMLNGVPDENHAYILKTNGGRPETAGIAMASWSGEAYASKGIRFADGTSSSPIGSIGKKPQGPSHDWGGSNAYTVFTATGENQESLAPLNNGTFTNPVAPQSTLRGSYFTQAFFAFLDYYKGEMEPAFDAASKFTAKTAIEISGGEKQQVPRKYSTIPLQQNNLYQ